MLSNNHKQFLKELAHNPMWQQIVAELKRPPVPKFSPANELKEKISSEQQIQKWIYASGQDTENQRILNLLNGE